MTPQQPRFGRIGGPLGDVSPGVWGTSRDWAMSRPAAATVPTAAPRNRRRSQVTLSWVIGRPLRIGSHRRCRRARTGRSLANPSTTAGSHPSIVPVKCWRNRSGTPCAAPNRRKASRTPSASRVPRGSCHVRVRHGRVLQVSGSVPDSTELEVRQVGRDQRPLRLNVPSSFRRKTRRRVGNAGLAPRCSRRSRCAPESHRRHRLDSRGGAAVRASSKYRFCSGQCVWMSAANVPRNPLRRRERRDRRDFGRLDARFAKQERQVVVGPHRVAVEVAELQRTPRRLPGVTRECLPRLLLLRDGLAGLRVDQDASPAGRSCASRMPKGSVRVR